MSNNDAGYVKALIFVLLRMVDAGERPSIDEASAHLRAGDLFVWLKTFKPTYGLEFFEGDVGERVGEGLERHRSAVHRSKIGVKNSGLLFLALLATELLSEFLSEG